MGGMNLAFAHATVLSLFAGLSYGYNTGIISGLNKPLIICQFFPRYLNASPGTPSSDMSAGQAAYAGVLTADILIGGLLGAFVGVPLAEKYGRRNAILLSAINGVFALFFVVSDEFWVNVAIRTFIGVGIGAQCTLVPLYITETVDDDVRGQVGTFFQVFVCLGIVVAQFANWVLKQDYDQSSPDPARYCVSEASWKGQLTIGALPAILLAFYAWLILPETSHWLTKLRSVERVNSSFQSLVSPLLPRGSANVAEAESEVSVSSIDEGAFYWHDLFCSIEGVPHARIALGLAFCVQLTGINAIIFYSPHIFKDADIENVLVVTLCVVGVWNAATVFIATALIDRLGRRVLMITGISLMTVGALALGVAYAALKAASKTFVAISAIMLFILGFEIGPGGLFFIMASESFPQRVRGKALVFANALSWVLNIFISTSFPVVSQLLGTAATFLMLGGFNLAALAFAVFSLPETRGATLE